MSKEMKLIPELRFPEFEKEGQWVIERLDRVVSNFIVPMRDKPKKLDGPIPWCRIEDFDGMYLSSSKSNQGVSLETIEEMNLKVYPVNSLLVSCSADLGRCAITAKELVTNQTFIGLVPNTRKANTIYLYFIMSNSRNELNARSSGTTISYLSRQEFEKFEIPIPPDEDCLEQQKIASCLSSLDELIAAHNEKLDALKDHKKGLLQNLFPQEGENVPKVRFPEFEGDGEWVDRELGNEIEYFKGFAFKSKDYTSNGRRIVRVSDMGFDYVKDEDKAIYINEDDAVQYEKWELAKDDLIITTVGSKPPVYDSLVGRTIVVQEKDSGSLLNQNAVCLRAKKIKQNFFNYLFKRNEYINFIESIIRGNANQGSITLENLFKYQIRIPESKEEQQKIASCLSALDELITAQQDKIEQLQQHKKGLMQGLFPKMTD